MPIYRVDHINAESGTKPRLVRAANQAQALRHVAVDVLRVEIAKPTELWELYKAGVTEETAGGAATEAAERYFLARQQQLPAPIGNEP